MRTSVFSPGPGVGQTVGGRPIMDRLTLTELEGLAALTRLAAVGALHENHSSLAAKLMGDAAWLDRKVSERHTRMQTAQRGQGGDHA